MHQNDSLTKTDIAAMFMSLAIDAMHYKHWTACVQLWIPCEKLSEIQFTSAGTQEKFNSKENQASTHKVDKSAPFKYAGAIHWLKQSLLHSGHAVSNWCNAQQALNCMHSAVNTIQAIPGLRSQQRTMTDFYNLKRSDNPKKVLKPIPQNLRTSQQTKPDSAS
jgi:hypothetical protein